MPSALIKMKVTGKKAVSAGGKGGIFEEEHVCMHVCLSVCEKDWVQTMLFSAKVR